MAKRKVKSKPGKASISPAHREPSGKIKRPTAAEIKASEKANRMKETVVVQMQPHRRGAKDQADPRFENPVGRFCIGVELPREQAAAMEQLVYMYRTWRLSMGLPCPWGQSSNGASSEAAAPDPDRWGESIRVDPDPERMRHRIDKAEFAMRDTSKAGLMAVRQMCSEREDVPSFLWPSAVIAAKALTRHFQQGGR